MTRQPLILLAASGLARLPGPGSPALPCDGGPGSIVLDPGVLAAVRRTAAEKGASTEAFLLAAWALLLRRHADGDVPLGVVVDGREYRGCGGDPVSVLQGEEWVVEDVNRTGIIDDSRLTLNFSADGRLMGRAGCNTYSGRYALTGEGLAIIDPVSTRKACAPALMQQEETFLKVLKGVQRFEISTTGALVLHAADERTITARR